MKQKLIIYFTDKMYVLLVIFPQF